MQVKGRSTLQNDIGNDDNAMTNWSKWLTGFALIALAAAAIACYAAYQNHKLTNRVQQLENSSLFMAINDSNTDVSNTDVLRTKLNQDQAQIGNLCGAIQDLQKAIQDLEPGARGVGVGSFFSC